jgi:hypothetical protein
MKDIAIDKDGKFVRTNFGFTMTSSIIDWVVQKLRVKLRTFLGEWYLDTTRGLPYFKVLEKNPNTKILEAAIKQSILEEEEVQEITQFSMTYDNSKRTLKPNFSVRVSTGETVEGGL